MGSFGSRNGFLEEAPWAGGGDAGLVGPEAILFLNGLFERRGDGLRSVLTTQLANPQTRRQRRGECWMLRASFVEEERLAYLEEPS